MNDAVRAGAITFVAVLAAVIAVGAVYGLVGTDDTAGSTIPDHVDVENPQYDADRVSSDRSPGEADVRVDTSVSDGEVVVHLGGGDERDVAPLVNGIIESGNEVTIVDEGGAVGEGAPILIDDEVSTQVAPPPREEEDEQAESTLEEALAEADGYINVGVDSYADEDSEALREFVDEDGRVVMTAEPTQEFSAGEGLSETYSELGIYTEPGYVYNLAENDLNYQRIFAQPDGASMLTGGVDRVVFDTVTPVSATLADETMVPTEGSELSVTREETQQPVLVRDDNVAMIGDTAFMTPENAQRADNDELIGNIGEFLLESDRTADTADDDTADDDTADDETDTVTVTVGEDGDPVFSPDIVEIEPGWTVEFVWDDDGHNLVPINQEPEDADWDGVEEQQDAGFVHEHTFEEEGVHEFVSEPFEDEGMFGVIIVEEP